MEADTPLAREGARRNRAAGLKPLRRKPKQLTEDPELQAAPSSGGSGSGTSRRDPRGHRQQASAAAAEPAGGITDDGAALVTEDPDAVIVDAEVARRARRIAARLSVPRARHDVVVRRGAGDVRSVRYRGSSDEIDMDATVGQLVEHPSPEDDDIIVRERMSTRRSVVLAVDVSGSMNGERAKTAAAAVGALFGELAKDQVAVVAFWSDASLLVPLGQPSSPQRVLDMLLRLPSRGLTNVSFPLEVAARQLARVPNRDARVLLLSDCVHNAGPDPREIASRLPRLDVLLDTSGEHDLDLGRDLTTVGRGRMATAASFRDVGPALSKVFTT